MNDRLEGVRIAGAEPREHGAGNGRGLSREAALSLARSGQVAYRVLDATSPVPGTPGRQSELRLDPRRRTRLRSAKVLDAGNAFICDAIIQDRSSAGLRLLLARNVGLPGRFGVHDDETGEVLTVTAAWRRPAWTDRTMPSSPRLRRRVGSSTAAAAARTSASLGATASLSERVRRRDQGLRRAHPVD